MPLLSSRIAEGIAEVDVLANRLSVVEIDRTFRDIAALFVRSDVRTVTVDLSRVDFVDNSFINLLRALAIEARLRRRAFRLTGVPMLLRFLASSTSHRLVWLSSLVPPDETSPSVAIMRQRKRASHRR
jgi:ABC-type transporter Mla MlaB component